MRCCSRTQRGRFLADAQGRVHILDQQSKRSRCVLACFSDARTKRAAEKNIGTAAPPQQKNSTSKRPPLLRSRARLSLVSKRVTPPINFGGVCVNSLAARRRTTRCGCAPPHTPTCLLFFLRRAHLRRLRPRGAHCLVRWHLLASPAPLRLRRVVRHAVLPLSTKNRQQEESCQCSASARRS